MAEVRARLGGSVVALMEVDPDAIHLPSIYVKRMILGAPYDKKIEFTTVRERAA